MHGIAMAPGEWAEPPVSESEHGEVEVVDEEEVVEMENLIDYEDMVGAA